MDPLKRNLRDTNEPVLEGEHGGPHIPAAPHFDTSSLFEIAWRNRRIIAASVVLALVTGFIYIMKATPIYTCTSRVYVEQSGPKILDEVEGVMTQSKNYLYTQVELIRSIPILADAVRALGVRRMKIFADIDNPVAYLKKSLDLSVGKKDDIISVSLDSPYPAEAAHLVNVLVDSYITYQATQKRSTSAEVLKILQKEKARRSIELSEKLKAMMNFKRNNTGLAFESRGGNVILDKLASLSEAVTQSQLQTIEAKSVYEVTKTMANDPERLKQFILAERAKGVYISSGESETLRLRSELERLEDKLVDVNQRVTSDHPMVKSLKAKIEKIKNRLVEIDGQFAQAQLMVAEQRYLAAKQRDKEIAGYFEEQRKQALDLNDQIAQYTILQSEWEQIKKLNDILDDRIKELNVTEDVGALNISILEVARVPDDPSKPQKARVMAIAMVLGLMLGGGLSLLRDWMDHRLRSSEEISAVLGVPVLGMVPSMSRKLTLSDRGREVDLKPNSKTAEAYRTIRTAVFFAVPKEEAKTVLITSPAPGDGKTTLVSNLAIAMARAGQKTLILDADFRKPRQHEVFKISEEPGLSSVLAGVTPLAECVQPTSVEGLYVLPCGPEAPNPSELLSSEAFGKLLGELSAGYDRILIDSPPVMPVTDAQILAAKSDISIIVLRAEKSTRNVSRQAQDGLLSVGARVLGAIVNDVSRKNGRYGYYRGYGYGYYGYYGGYGHYGRYGRKSSEEQATSPKESG